MKKRILLVPVLIMGLSACGATTSSDYTSLYNANLKAEIQKIDETVTALTPSREYTGHISGGLEMIENGMDTNMAFAADYDTFNEKQNAQLTLKSPTFSTSGKQGDAEVKIEGSFQEMSLIATSMRNLVKYSGMNATVTSSDDTVKQSVEADIKATIEKLAQFDGKWIDLSNFEELPTDVRDALLKLATLSVSDIEKYLTDYQLVSAKDAGKQDGSRYTFAVELNREKLVDLMATLAQDFTGKTVSPEEKQEMLTHLQEIFLTGTTTYDAKNPLYREIKWVVFQGENSPTKLHIDSIRDGDKYNLTFTAKQADNDAGKLTIDSMTQGNKTDFTVKLVTFQGSGENEMALVTGMIEDMRLKNLNAKIDAGVVSGELVYTDKDTLSIIVNSPFMGGELFNLTNTFSGENFEGKASVSGKAAANWKVAVMNKTLTGLELIVKDFINQSEADMVTLKLEKQDGNTMTRGKLTLRDGESEVLSADVSLEMIMNEKFGFILENIVSPYFDDMGTVLKKAELFATSKESKTNRKVEIPKEAVSLFEVEKALGIRMDGDVLMEEMQDRAQMGTEAADMMSEVSGDACEVYMAYLECSAAKAGSDTAVLDQMKRSFESIPETERTLACAEAIKETKNYPLVPGCSL